MVLKKPIPRSDSDRSIYKKSIFKKNNILVRI